jgi:hypothetical protein
MSDHGMYAVSDGEKIRRFPPRAGETTTYTVIAGDPDGKPYLTDDAHFYGVRALTPIQRTMCILLKSWVGACSSLTPWATWCGRLARAATTQPSA